MEENLNPELLRFVAALDFSDVDHKRKITLQPLIDFIVDKLSLNDPVLLNFICTHNSRRSHLSQVWAQTAAAYFGIPNVFCYSGGTEATALFPVVAETLMQTGFTFSKISDNANPVYAIKYSGRSHPIIGFSKVYDHSFNPEKNFAAILTCSQADENCPIISGAEKRIPVTYDDPKIYDNTEQQSEKYHERSVQIATEMFYVFSQIRK